MNKKDLVNFDLDIINLSGKLPTGENDAFVYMRTNETKKDLMDSFFKTGGRNDSIPGMIGSSMLKSEEFKIDMFNSLLFYFGHSGDLDELNKFKEKLTDVFLDQKRIN